MRAAVLVQAVAFFRLYVAANEVAGPSMEIGAEKPQRAVGEAIRKANDEMKRAEAETMRAQKVTAEAKDERKYADAENRAAQQVVAKANNEMRLAAEAQRDAKHIAAKAGNEMRQAAASKSAAEQATAEVKHSMKQAEAEKAKAEHISAIELTEMKQALAGEREAKQTAITSRTETKQANAAKDRAEQATVILKHEMEQVEAEKKRADHVAAQAVEKLNKAYSTEGSMTFALVGLSVTALMLVAVVAFLKNQLSHKEQSLAEPLLEGAAVEPEPPKPKPFEGRWRREDGTVVQINGDKLVHDDGRQETVADLEEQTLYTHRMSVKKGWFAETPVVRGASGKVDEDGYIRWHDGRVWVKADEVDEQQLGA